MKPSFTILAATFLACHAAAQNCPAGKPVEANSSPTELSLGAPLAAVTTALGEQQEKAPPDSVFVDVMPAPKKKVDPLYPKLALAAGIEGKVYVRLWVDTGGKVHDVKVVKSDHEVLNQSAIDAARQYEFAPATAGGKPVSVWVTIPFMFKIADKAEAPYPALRGVVGCIMTLLSEKDIAKCRSAITPDAHAVIGNHYVPLDDAIERRGTPKGLPDEHGWELGLVHTIMDDGTQLATLLLQTVQKKTGAFRFHTVVCVRSGDGEWRIRHWHVGQ